MKTLRHVVALSLALFLALPPAWAGVTFQFCAPVMHKNTPMLPFNTMLGPWNNPALTVNPLNTNRLFVGVNNYASSSFGSSVWAFTANGGMNWTTGQFPLKTSDGITYTNGSDAELYFDNRTGEYYFTQSLFNASDDSNAVVFGKVTNLNPVTFSIPVAVAKEAAGSGKFLVDPQMAVTKVGSTTTFDIFFDLQDSKLNTSEVDESLSTNGGATWSSPQIIAPSLTQVQSYRVVVETGARNGLGVELTAPSGPTDVIWFTESLDGGKTFNAPNNIATFTPPNFAALGPDINNPDAAWNAATQTAELVYAVSMGTVGSETVSFFYDPATSTASTPVVINDSTTGNHFQSGAATDPATGQLYVMWADDRNINPTEPVSTYQFFATQTPNGSSFSVNTAIDPTTNPGSLVGSGPPNVFNRVVEAGFHAIYFPTIQYGLDGNANDSTVVVTKLSEVVDDFAAFMSGPSSVPTGSTFTVSLAVTGPTAPFTFTTIIPTGLVFQSLQPDPSLSCTTPPVGSSGKIVCKPNNMFSGGATATATEQATAPAGTTVIQRNQVSGPWCDSTPNDNRQQLMIGTTK